MLSHLHPSVTKQIHTTCVFHSFEVHCMAHFFKLVVQTLLSLPLVMHHENLLQCLYSYFTHSPNRHLELTKLVNIMSTKGNEILQNVKTRMLSPTKKVMVEYTTFLVNMALDNLTNQQVMLNYEHLCDLQLCLNLLTFCHYLNFACFHQVFIF
jgi:hypothetical protein